MGRIKVTKPQIIEPSTLIDGESIEISLSFQVQIDGDDAWVGCKVFGRQQEDEETCELQDRLLSTAKSTIKKATISAVETARELEES